MRPSYILPIGLIVLAFALGGASSGQPFRDMVIELFAVVVLGASAAGLIGERFSADARLPLILLAALALLFAFQLVPVPASIWSSLGGRQFSASVLELVQVGARSRPLSLQPEQTVLSALAVLPGAAMAVAVMRLDSRHRVVLAWAAVIAALLSLMLGTVQVAMGAGARELTLYPSSHTGLPLGVFANTNHQADLLVAGFVLAGCLAAPRGMAGDSWLEKPYWIYGLMVLFAIGVVATGSRAGIALLGVALVAVLLRERLSGHVRLFILGGVILAIALLLLILFNPVFYRSFADFSDLDDPRFHFWPNVLWAIGHFGWLGTGAGTFDGVYRSAETLDTLTSNFVNHAHNDYLEIALEMGIPGMLLLLVFLGFLATRAVSIIRRTEARVSRSLAYGGMVCAGVLLLHSVADYPLRTPLLGVMFGLFCGLMTRSPGAANGLRPDNSARNQTAGGSLAG